MKNLLKPLLSTFCFAAVAIHGNAQQIFTDAIKDAHDSNADGDQKVYSQARSLTEKLPLDLMAVNAPEQFEGLPVTNLEGTQIGQVVAVARKNTDQALHLIINTTDDVQAAIRIDELTLEALAYWDPAGALNDQQLDESAFEPVSQYQTGHSAWGSLTRPTVEPVQPKSGEQPANINATTAAESSVLADAADNANSAAPVYEPVGSSIVQLALNRPDAFQQKLLVGRQGETLGEIAYIARNLQNQQLYAVVTRADNGSHTAVKLDALTIGRLGYAGLTHDGVREFDEDEFARIGNR